MRRPPAAPPPPAAPLLVVAPAQAEPSDHGRHDTYLLNGDAGGSKFEGIGADERRGLFYVSEVTGGEIHRGSAGAGETGEGVRGGGAGGRFSAPGGAPGGGRGGCRGGGGGGARARGAPPPG